jgi:hypothetical protein
MLNITKGVLLEYGLSLPPLSLTFEFNPQTLSRTRTITLSTSNTPATRGGYDFTSPHETARVAQGVTVQPEQFSIDILLDATDRMNSGDPVATQFGVEPELDTLRSMVEPKLQGPSGFKTLASLDPNGQRSFQINEKASVLLFVWGTHILPVFLTSVRIDEQAHLPTLIPYRAKANLSFQIIEGNNPFYQVEKVRQLIGAGMNLAAGASVSVSASFGASF